MAVKVVRVFILSRPHRARPRAGLSFIRGVMDESANISEQLKGVTEKGSGLPQTDYNQLILTAMITKSQQLQNQMILLANKKAPVNNLIQRFEIGLSEGLLWAPRPESGPEDRPLTGKEQIKCRWLSSQTNHAIFVYHSNNLRFFAADLPANCLHSL